MQLVAFVSGFLIWHNIFKVSFYCSMYQYFIPFVTELYSFVWLQYILFICSSIDEHLGCFYLLAILINVAMIFLYWFRYGLRFSVLLDIYLRVKLLSHTVNPYV
jgi:hypothetical protein